MYDNFINVIIDGNSKEVILVFDFKIDNDKNVLVYLNKEELHTDNLILRYSYYNIVDGVYHLTKISENDRNLINNIVINLIDELRKANLSQ